MTSRDAGSCWGTADGWCRLGGSLLEFSDLTGKDDPIHLSLETTDENKMVLICTDADTDGTYCETDGDGGPVEFVRRFCLKNHDWWDYWDDGQVHLPRHKQVAIFVGFPVAEGVGTAPVSCGSGAQSDEASLRVMTPELPIRPIEGVAWTEGNGYVGREVNDTLEDRRSKACNENGLTAGERCDVWTIVQDLWSCGYPLEELPEDARKLVEQLLGEAPEIVQNVVDEARDQAHDAKCKARDTVEEVT